MKGVKNLTKPFLQSQMMTEEFIGECFFIHFLVSVDLGVMATDFVICRLFLASVGSLLNCKIHIFSKVTTHKHILLLADICIHQKGQR